MTRYATQFPADPTFAEVRSGRDDSLLCQAASGRWIYDYGGDHPLSDLDTDGDGRPDLIVSVARETSQGGALYVYANSGQLRYPYPIPGATPTWGRSATSTATAATTSGTWTQPAQDLAASLRLAAPPADGGPLWF